jgi:hypothetical protein
MINHRISRSALGLASAGLVLLSAPGGATAGALCRDVEGSYDEHAVLGPSCPSPVGLCIAGTYRGEVKGAFEGRASAVLPTADTAATTVQLFTADSTITASVGSRKGRLMIKNAGGFTGNPDGSIVDLQTIVGGTGGLTGASGSLRATGTFFFATGGHSTWKGTLCLP